MTIIGDLPEAEQLYANIKPVRYRYVMTYLHDETIDGVLHLGGEVIAVLPMTSVNYSISLYVGTEMNGNVYLPDFYLDLMPHQPLQDFERRTHPDQGMPLGAMFECGNRAIYVMRNEKVVWGGILWTRSYTSGTPVLSISALSWEGYAYYRALRRTVSFPKERNVYTIWYALLKQMLTDFSWKGVKITDEDGEDKWVDGGWTTEAVTHPHGNPDKSRAVLWTGLTRKPDPDKPAQFHVPARNFYERWPYSSPDIELPPQDLKWMRKDKQVKATKTWRGYDMAKVGEALAEWADTETITSVSGGKRFEYRVLCWFDTKNQRFRQRYVFGRMSYATDSTPDDPKPNGILSPLLGANTQDKVQQDTNKLIFDFPGHISTWSLSESMDEAATRVIVTSGEDAAAKHAHYASDTLLDVPDEGGNRSERGWRLYDQTASYDLTGQKKMLSNLRDRALTLLKLYHVPEAAQINDLAAANTEKGQRTSIRATTFSASLYQEPTVPFPDFELGDWAMFAIADPFYGGVMYLRRRIIGYNVTVVPDHESDYSHESIELELTDDTKVETGE